MTGFWFCLCGMFRFFVEITFNSNKKITSFEYYEQMIDAFYIAFTFLHIIISNILIAESIEGESDIKLYLIISLLILSYGSGDVNMYTDLQEHKLLCSTDYTILKLVSMNIFGGTILTCHCFILKHSYFF